MSRPEDLRVSDADRDAVAAALREHFAQGRLTLDELDQRLGAAFAARTRGDLAPVTADLPRTAAAPRTEAGAARQRYDWYPHDRYPHDWYPRDRYPHDRYPRGRYPRGPWRYGPPFPPVFLLIGFWLLFAAAHGHPAAVIVPLLVVFAILVRRRRSGWGHPARGWRYATNPWDHPARGWAHHTGGRIMEEVRSAPSPPARRSGETR